MEKRQMKLYHAASREHLRKYEVYGMIKTPVRGFDTIDGAKEYCRRYGRDMVIECEAYDVHKLPDHHNKFGTAYWNDGDITVFNIVWRK